MRDQITTYLGKQKLGTFGLAKELPWSADGTPLFQKNFKKLYVSEPEVNQSDDIMTLRGPVAVRETTSVSVYFTTDAKTLPENYETVVDTVVNARLLSTITGVMERQADVAKNLEGDRMITTVTLRFSKLISN